MQLSDDERKAFETYLFAGEDQALKEKSLDNLVEGSIPYYYLYFINKLKNGGVASLTEKDNEMFVKFTETKNNKNTPQAKQVKLWHTLLKIDVETDPSQKQALLELFEKESIAIRKRSVSFVKNEEAILFTVRFNVKSQSVSG